LARGRGGFWFGVVAFFLLGAGASAIGVAFDWRRLRQSTLWGTPAWRDAVLVGVAVALAPFVLFLVSRLAARTHGARHAARGGTPDWFGPVGVAFYAAMAVIVALTHGRGGNPPADSFVVVAAVACSLVLFALLGLTAIVFPVMLWVGDRRRSDRD